jgi:hypothetical protein
MFQIEYALLRTLSLPERPRVPWLHQLGHYLAGLGEEVEEEAEEEVEEEVVEVEEVTCDQPDQRLADKGPDDIGAGDGVLVWMSCRSAMMPLLDLTH